VNDAYAQVDPVTIARMSRFSYTERCRSLVLLMATSTMARVRTSAGITWLGNHARNAG
jgi:hypothetical protein